MEVDLRTWIYCQQTYFLYMRCGGYLIMVVLKKAATISTAEHEELNSVECRVAQMHTCLLLMFRQTNKRALLIWESSGRMCGGECLGICCELWYRTLCHLYLSQSFMKISTTSIVIVVYSCNCIDINKKVLENQIFVRLYSSRQQLERSTASSEWRTKEG